MSDEEEGGVIIVVDGAGGGRMGESVMGESGVEYEGLTIACISDGIVVDDGPTTGVADIESLPRNLSSTYSESSAVVPLTSPASSAGLKRPSSRTTADSSRPAPSSTEWRKRRRSLQRSHSANSIARRRTRSVSVEGDERRSSVWRTSRYEVAVLSWPV